MRASSTGKVTAEPAEPGKGDNTLPDPTNTAKWCAFGLVVAALLLALVLNWLGATPAKGQVLDASTETTANFALFAGFYVAAQVLAAVLLFVSPFVPFWKPPTDVTDKTAKAAQTKADRAVLLLGLGAVGGVALSCTLGLFFLEAVGMHASHTVDAIFTGATLTGGAKPLSDFVKLIQNKGAPTTGTGDGT
jgi:hypothetical protein